MTSAKATWTAETAVVVGSDGSPIGDAVVRRGAVLAAASGGCLHIVTPVEALIATIRSVDPGVSADGHPASGDLTAAVWRVAVQVDADVILVARAARSRLRRALAALRRRLGPDGWVSVELIDLRAARAQLAARMGRVASG